MNLAVEYIKYRCKAKGRHGTHSPFIYQFVDKCLQIKVEKEDATAFKSLISSLSGDKRKLFVSDFGVGSKKLKKERKISEILQTSSSRGKYAKLFYQLAAYYQPKQILEFGTSLGIGTIHFAKGNPSSSITTVEACPATAQIALENFAQLNIKNVNLHNTTFVDYCSAKSKSTFDVMFIDGHHDGEALLKYITLLEENMHQDTFVILDDIRWSNSMFDAWNQLKNDSRFNVSIDLFRMGILLKRPQQHKEHFIVQL